MKLAEYVNVSVTTDRATLGTDDILIQRVGDSDTVGKPYRATDTTAPKNCLTVSLNDTGKVLIVPDYLFYVLTALHMQGYFRRLAHGTAQQCIRVSDVEDIPIQLT
jgi:restriction endonuclease S subunit